MQSKYTIREMAVTNFDKVQYLGKWYEIARLDFRYERGLSNTTAEYQQNDDCSIKVINRGYDIKKQVWKQAKGRAKFIGDEHIAMLKVSFFWPFFSEYNVIALDSHYRYALVAGKNLSYLWILSRTKDVPSNILSEYLNHAEQLGFNTSRLIWVEHDL